MTLVLTHLARHGGHHLRQQELLNKSASSEKAISRLYLEMVLLSLSFLSLNIINAFSPTDVNSLTLESRTQNYTLCVCFYWRTLKQHRNLYFSGMLQSLYASFDPASQKCMYLMLGALQCTVHSDTNIYKTKKVRKSKTYLNQHIH